MSGSFFRSTLFTIALHLLVIPCALAAPGALDSTFNGSGVSIYNGLATANYAARGVAVQSDEKIVVVGYVHNGTDQDMLITRYNSNGTLDSSFGDGGAATFDGWHDDFAYAVAIQADGKIIVGGHSHNGAYDDLIVLRYTSEGKLDSTFDSDGANSV